MTTKDQDARVDDSRYGERSGISADLELNRAEIIAKLAHHGQKDTVTGRPYIEHVARVAWEMPDEDGQAQTVAWLHDVIEDSMLSKIDLLTLGFSPQVVVAVDLLTRKRGLPYEIYINRMIASGNQLALMVKRADLRDHLTPNCPERLRPRYEAALPKIEAAISAGLPADWRGNDAGPQATIPAPEIQKREDTPTAIAKAESR